jgi:hypothetical protein
MKELPIDKLLTWALLDELPKGHPVSTSAWDIVVSYSRLGARIQTGGHGDGLGFVQGEPHPDAVLIAARLRDLSSVERLTRAQCEALIGRYAALDPLAVKAITGAAFNPVALLINCAVLAKPMEWDIGLPRCIPAVRHPGQRHAAAFVRNDEGVLVLARANGRGSYPVGSETHLAWDEPSIGVLLETRATYAIWHAALCALARDLHGRLAEHAAKPPLAVATPWDSGQPKATVHKSSPRKLARLPLAPRRGVALPPLESDIERTSRLARQRGRRAAP